MTPASKTCLALALAAFAAFGPVSAFARHGADDGAAQPAPSAAAATLAIRLRSQSHGRWEFRMSIENAAAGLGPEAFVADATGALVSAGLLTPDRHHAGQYRLRLRGGADTALPAGAASIADLGGRAYEVRESGAVMFSGTLPTVREKKSGSGGGTGGGSGSGGADDPATHDAGDDNGGRSGSGADDGSGHR